MLHFGTFFAVLLVYGKKFFRVVIEVSSISGTAVLPIPRSSR
jgi:hypothetical protein